MSSVIGKKVEYTGEFIFFFQTADMRRYKKGDQFIVDDERTMGQIHMYKLRGLRGPVAAASFIVCKED